MSEVRRPVAFVVLALLCGQFLVLGLVQASRDSVAVDEGYGLASAIVVVERHDLRLLPEHALLHNGLAGVLPSLLADPEVPITASYEDGDWFEYTEDFIRANDRAGHLDDLVFWYRVTPLLLSVGTALVLYALASRLAGRGGGLVASGLWLTTPYVVGLAHLGSLDVTFTFWVALVALSIDRYRTSVTTGRASTLAVVLGGALATRHTALALVPVAVVVVLTGARDLERRRSLAHLAIILVVPLATVWAAYRLADPTPVQGPPRARFDGLIAAASEDSLVQRVALSVPFPVEWRAGLAHLFETSKPRPAYAVGQGWVGGRPWYLPVNAAVKLPVSFWVACATGAVGWVVSKSPSGKRLAWTVGLVSAALTLFLVVQPLNLGLRLALPVLALASVVASGLLFHRRAVTLLVLVTCGVAQLAATWVAHPHSLAWTPPPFSDGYRHVSDSSVDLGQAARAVQREHQRDPFVAASLLLPLGLDLPRDVPEVADLNPGELVGRVAVSATSLTVLSRDQLGWLRGYCPVEVIGRSVLVYEFSAPPDTSPGPTTPAAPCPGRESRRSP